MKKVEIRKDIYKIFEELSGKQITPEQHQKLKSCILSYQELDGGEITKMNKTIQTQGQKLKEMAKIIYHKAWDAEILEKHIRFLRKLFQETELLK